MCVSVCELGEEGAVRVAITVIRRWKRMIQGDGSSSQRTGDFTKPYKELSYPQNKCKFHILVPFINQAVRHTA